MISRYLQKKSKRTKYPDTNNKNVQADREMEFGIEKCAMLIMKSGKRETIEEIKLPNQENMRKLKEKENYKNLGILKADTIKQTEWKK